MDRLFNVDGNVIIVAGGGGAIGARIAQELARRGARCVMADLDAEKLDAACRDWPGTSAPRKVTLDATSAESVSALIDSAMAAFGRIDGLVNATGYIHIAPAQTMPEAAFRRSLDINVTGAFLLSRTAAKVMTSGGRIVHLASVSSSVANRDYAAYATAKAGLAQLVRVLAREWAERGITVNALGPAMIETPFIAANLEDPAFRAAALSVIPMGRFGTVDDLVGPAIMLLSDAGRFITGQTLYVDGGRTLVG